MEPRDVPPNQEADSSEKGEQPLNLAEHEAIEEVGEVLSFRLLDAYEAYVGASSRTEPPDSWWHDAALRCCLDMLLIDYRVSPDILRQSVQDYLAHDSLSASPADYAERIRMGHESAESEVRVLAVSLDPDPSAVRRFLGADQPTSVMLAEGDDVEDVFDVRSLPVTFVLNAGGNLRLRLDGPRAWGAEAVRSLVEERSATP